MAKLIIPLQRASLSQVHRNRSQEVGPSQRCVTVHAAAADDAIDVTSKNLDDALSQVKTGVARLRGVRGSPFKVGCIPH